MWCTFIRGVEYGELSVWGHSYEPSTVVKAGENTLFIILAYCLVMSFVGEGPGGAAGRPRWRRRRHLCGEPTKLRTPAWKEREAQEGRGLGVGKTLELRSTLPRQVYNKKRANQVEKRPPLCFAI